MLVEWIVDGEGPGPTYADDGKSVRIPVGTIMGVGAPIGDADCWMLCFPDNSGDARRGIPGLIHCKPHDDECKKKVEDRLRNFTPTQRQWFDKALKRAAVVRKEQAAKAEADAKAGIEPMPIHPDLIEVPAEADVPT